MAESARDERFIQIGCTALRDAKGGFLPAVPVYIRVPAKDVDQQTGFSEGEKVLFEELGGVLADRFRQYVEENKKSGLTV